MYKIYYGEKSLIIQSELDGMMKEGNTLHFAYSKTGLENALEALNRDDVQICIVSADDQEEALKAFKKRYMVILAGGGLVHTPDGFILLIFRRGKWDLPKGKLDEGEDIEQCAIREVVEETGLASPVIKEKILVTYHTYVERGKEILKESHWYRMFVRDKQNLLPQTEEDIEICKWVHIDDLIHYTENMHPSIIDVLGERVKNI